MNTDIAIKRKRGRPRKLPSLPTVVEEPKGTIVEEVQPQETELTEKKIVTRKSNPWIQHCKEVQARPENAGKSYREILKLAKLEYNK